MKNPNWTNSFLLVSFFLLTTMSIHSFASDYYVSASGSNSGGDGSKGKPWKSLQKAAKILKAGDVVLIAPGIYKEMVHVTCVGTASAPITFKALEPKNKPVIDAQNQKSGIQRCMFIDAIETPGKDRYITLDGIKMINGFKNCLRVGMADHVTVVNCEFENGGGYGNVSLESSYYSLVENCIMSGNYNKQHGIYLANSTKHCVVRGCLIYNNTGAGIHNNGDKKALDRPGNDGVCQDNILERNVIYNNGVAINMDSCKDYTIRNNLLYNGNKGGIHIYVGDGAASGNNKVYNNTVVFAAKKGFSCLLVKNSPNLDVRNNIFVCGVSGTDRACLETTSADVSTMTYTNNILFSRLGTGVVSIDGEEIFDLAEWQSMSGKGQNCKQVLPAFIQDGVDFHLQAASPGVDQGVPLIGIVEDNERGGRPAGSGFDIGCYEYGAKKSSKLK